MLYFLELKWWQSISIYTFVWIDEYRSTVDVWVRIAFNNSFYGQEISLGEKCQLHAGT